MLETPGHTPESICLVIMDEEKSPNPWAVLTGDTLFLGDVAQNFIRNDQPRATHCSAHHEIPPRDVLHLRCQVLGTSGPAPNPVLVPPTSIQCARTIENASSSRLKKHGT